MRKSNRKGFTIVELVIVIAVIAILTAVLIPTFSSITKKAKKSQDDQLVANLNKALSAEYPDEKPATMQDALDVVAEYGYNVAKINAKNKDYEIVWDSVSNKFINTSKNTVSGVRYWVVLDTVAKVNARNDCSIYYSGEDTDTPIVVHKGFDSGNSVVSQIKYENKGAAQEVVIRTNSYLTSLTIDAPNDTVYHYNKAGSVNVISAHTSSYHENGVVPFIEVSGGHIVLEAQAKVTNLHFTATDGEFKNQDNKTISLDLSKVSEENMPTFTRDDVEIEENGTYVAEVTIEKKEFIWLFGNGIKEQMVVTESTGAIAESGTLKTGITAGAEEGSVADQIANPAKRNEQGELVDNSGEVIDLTEVDWTKKDALAEVEEIVYEELKSKEETKQIVEEVINAEVAQEVGEAEYATYEARIGTKGYESFRAAVEAATAGQTVTLLKDITLARISSSDNVAVSVTKDLTIDGNGHTIKTTAGRGIWVNEEGVTLNVKNLTLKGAADNGSNSMERGLQVNGGISNVTLNVYNCTIISKTYGINICNAADNINVNIKKSTIQGWAAMQTWSNGYEFVVENSTLIGINYTTDKKYAFATVCLEGDSTGATNFHSSNNRVYIKNTEIRAEHPGDNRTNGQYLIGFNSLSMTNTVILENCTFFANATNGRTAYNNGTGNTLTIIGGSSNIDLSNYLADGYAVHENEDGTYNYVSAAFKVTVTYQYSNISKELSEYDVVYVDFWTVAEMQGAQDENGNECPRYISSTDTTLYSLDGEEWLSGEEVAAYIINYYNSGYKAWASNYLYVEEDNVVVYFFETEAEANEFVEVNGGVKEAL